MTMESMKKIFETSCLYKTKVEENLFVAKYILGVLSWFVVEIPSVVKTCVVC